MPHLRSALAGFVLSAGCVGSTAAAKVMDIKWDELPVLPPSPGLASQPGLAGPFAGAQGEALLVGGGANFPEKPPWQGGRKVWWDDLFVLERTSDGPPRWVVDQHFKLPRALGYGMSFSTPEGVICAGGCDAAQCYRDVFMLWWNFRTRAVVTTALPALPEPLAFMGGAMVGHVLFLAGGQQSMQNAVASHSFWALDLSKRDRPGEFKWEVLPAWPGPPRIVPVAAAQRSDRGDGFYLFSGRLARAGQPTEILTDAYVYEPARRRWKTLAPISRTGKEGASGPAAKWSVMAGTAAPAGRDEILLFSGDDGELFLRLEAYDLEVEARRQKLPAASPSERIRLQGEIDARLLEKEKIYARHPGFNREVLAYDTRHDSWRLAMQLPGPGQVTTIAVPWGEAVVIPSGEIRPGIRTDRITRLIPILK